MQGREGNADLPCTVLKEISFEDRRELVYVVGALWVFAAAMASGE